MANSPNMSYEDHGSSNNDETTDVEEIEQESNVSANEPTTTLDKVPQKLKATERQIYKLSKITKKVSPKTHKNIKISAKSNGNYDHGRNYMEDIKFLISKEEINKPGRGGTPLSKFIQLGRADIVKFLLDSGANSCKLSYGKTPLLLAVEKENLEIVQLLLEHGAEHTILTALFEAIILGNLEIVKTLLKGKVELNVIYKNGYTPLIAAIETENVHILKEIVEKGANVNMPDSKGRVPLVVSLETKSMDITSYLFEKGARLDETQIDLKKYIEEANLPIIKFLVEVLKINIDIIFPDCDYSPLTKAAELGNLEIVKYFIKQNQKNVNKCDQNEKTALSAAARNQDLPMVKFLLSAGGDLKLAKIEINEFFRSCEDFSLYLQSPNHLNKGQKVVLRNS